MIKIDFLKNHKSAITKLIEIWHEGIAKIWLPDYSIDKVKEQFNNHLNDNSLPITLVAFSDGMQPIGMCSLRENDGLNSNLTPWLGSLVVDYAYQCKGIGKELINATKQKARDLGYKKLYLFAFDINIIPYYVSLGWKTIGTDEYKGHKIAIMETELENVYSFTT
jgi:GNAT superfamily N-acetyltransferase